MRILAIGDSNATKQSFIAEAARILSAELVDFAEPGIRARDVAARLRKVKPSADLVVLLVGTNDLPEVKRRGISAFNQAYLTVLTLLLESSDRVIACTLPPYSDGTQTDVLKAMNNQIRQICLRSGAEAFDLYAEITDINGMLANPGDFIDGLHLSVFGRVRAGLALAIQISGPTDNCDMQENVRNRSLAEPTPLTAFLIGRRVPLLSSFAFRSEMRRLKSLGFDEQFYKEKNIDVTLFNVDPLSHFIQAGLLEGRLFRFIKSRT